MRSLSKALGTERLPRTRIAATTGLLVILGFCPHLDASPGARARGYGAGSELSAGPSAPMSVFKLGLAPPDFWAVDKGAVNSGG